MDETTSTEAAAPASLDEALGSGELIDEIQASLGAEGEQQAPPGDAAAVAPMDLEELHEGDAAGASVRDLDLLSEVDVEVSVEFGRVSIPIRQLLKLRRGSLVELARRPEQQVTVLANGRPIALGDVVVVDDQVGVHIVELIDPDAPPEAVAPPPQVDMMDDADEVEDAAEADDEVDAVPDAEADA